MKWSKWSVLLVFVVAGMVLAAESVEKVELKLSAAQQASVDKIKEAGGMVLRVASNTTALDVAFHLSDKKNVDAALKGLAGVPNVTKLNLAGTDVTDAGLASLAGISSLTHLHLERTKIGDAGLAHLKGLSNLEYINLYGTQVTDKGISQLKGLKKLKKVYLWQSKATKAGGEALAKAIPGVYVNTGWVAPKIAPKPVPTPTKGPEKLTLKVIMTKGHKGDTSLIAKTLTKKASKAEIKTLVSYYTFMAKAKPKKGDAGSWKKKTAALLAASKLIEKGDAKGFVALKTASNCKACHSVHK